MSATESPDVEVGSSVPVGSQSIFAGPLRVVSIGLLILVTLIAFEAMAVGAALPTAAREVHGIGGYGWAFTGFLVANVVAMVVSGMISDRRGARLPLTIGLILFFAGLLVSGTAPTMWQLVLGRVVQGTGSGLIITAAYVVIGEVYAAAQRPRFMAAMSSAWVVPSLVGPPVAGFLTQHITWRLVFLGLAPLVAVGGLLTLPTLRQLHDKRGTIEPGNRLRMLRALVVAVSIAILEQAGQHPTTVWLVVSPLGLVGLIWSLAGLLPRGTIRVRPGVPTAVALRGMLAGSIFGVEALIPLSLTVQHGFGATVAAMPLLGSALGWAAGSWYQGRYRGPSRHQIIRAGFAFVAVAAVGVAIAAPTASSGWLIYPAWIVGGIGAGLAMSSVSVLLLDCTTDADRGRDSAALQLSDGVASALTTGIGGMLVAAAARGSLSYATAFITVDGLMFLLAASGAVLSGRAR